MKSSHIDTELLADFIEGLLPRDIKQRMEEHLSECNDCREEFVVANNLLRDSELCEQKPISQEKSKKVWDVLRPLVAKLHKWVSEVPVQFRQPQLMAVRGNDASVPVEKCVHVERKLGDLSIAVDFNKNTEDSFSVQFKTIDGSLSPKAQRLIVLEERGSIHSHCLKSEAINLHNLPFGTYSVVLTENAKEKGCFSFQINKEGVVTD